MFLLLFFVIFQLNSVEVYINRFKEPKESNDVSYIPLHCIVFELSACENSAES